MISRILSIKSSQTLPFKIMNGFVEFLFIFFLFILVLFLEEREKKI